MPTTEEKRSKRRAARDRLRVEFLSQTGPKLSEFHALLMDSHGDQEALESLAHGLARLANTAASLDLGDVARTASQAASAVRDGSGRSELQALSRAVRGTASRPLFGRVVLVASGSLAESVERDAQTVTEPVRIVSALTDLPGALDHQSPGVIAIPAADIEAVIEQSGAEDHPIVVFGNARDWPTRLHAVAAGARGFLAEPFRLADLLELGRWYRMQEDVVKPAVFVLAEASQARADLLSALEDAGMSTMASARPAEIAPALDAVCPDALVFGAHVGGSDAEVLVSAVRRHPEGGFVPIVVMGTAVPDALFGAGADDVLPPIVAVEAVLERVLVRVARFSSIRRERDAVTGLPNRMGVLRLLDRHLTNAKRRGTTLAACLCQIDDLEALRDRYGKTAVNAAQRALADALEGGVRRVDVVGQLDATTFIAALPECRSFEAARRMGEIQKRFLWRCRADARLKALHFNVGVADSDSGIPTLVTRAEAALLQSRAANNG